MNLCIFCVSSLDYEQEVVTLGVKGCEGIAQASRAQGSSITTLPGQQVHVTCCQRHCNKKRTEQSCVMQCLIHSKKSHVTIT